MDLESLRRSILHRQGLVVPFDEPMEAVRAMVAVQTQYAASLPVAVATRVKKCKVGWDDHALRPGGELIKSWSLRHTLHAHARDDHSLVVGSLGPHLYGNYVRFMEQRKKRDNVAELEERVLEALQAGPITRKELHEAIPELKTIEDVGWGLDVMGLAFRRRLCLVGRGADQKFCALPDEDVAPSYGQLLKRYLASYGPASVSDFAFWTGLKGPQVKKAFAEAANEIVQIQIDGMKGVRFALSETLLDLPTDNLGVRLLAKFDPLVLSHKDKSIFIAPEFKQRVFRIAGQVEAVVLMDGYAAGTWRMDKKASRAIITVEPFRKFGKREDVRLQKEAERIAKALGLKAAEVLYQ